MKGSGSSMGDEGFEPVIDAALVAEVKRWLKNRMGVPVSETRDGVTPVVAADPNTADEPLRAVRLGHETMLVARGEWVEALREVVATLHPEILFSTFGAYELARVTLPDGVAVWGPDYYLFGDDRTVRAVEDSRVLHLGPSDLGDFDYSVFWHCHPDSLAGFAVLDRHNLLALATVWDVGEPFWEIGMDVAPSARRAGLGKAVVGSAARWILEHRKLAAASVAPFNSPSLRTLRSVGLRYVFTSMRGVEGPMKLHPQQLGVPLPNTPLYNYYPDWAMNHDILPKKD